MPELYIIAGCNGAGKSTAAYTLLPDIFNTVEFVNADEIARGLSPFNIEGVAFQAGRIMLERLNYLISEKKSLAFETTLSGYTYFKLIEHAKQKNYTVCFFFVFLDSVDLAKQRVKIRVKKGGHSIPEHIIERRYVKGLINFSKYAQISDDWYIYDNSGSEYKLVAKKVFDNQEVFNFDVFNKIINCGHT